jgi:hypothetical protein
MEISKADALSKIANLRKEDTQEITLDDQKSNRFCMNFMMNH